MKRATVKKEAPKNRAEAIHVCSKQREDLSQAKTPARSERIPYHIQEIIRLKGRKKFKEIMKHLKRNHD